MPFISNGLVHYSGINNELKNTQFLKKGSVFIRTYLQYLYGDTIDFQHKGGTQNTDDAIITTNGNRIAGISYKHHKSGTFDWLNTSKNIPNLVQLKQTFDEFKTKYPSITGEYFKEHEKVLRNERDNIIYNHLNNLN